MGAAHPAAPTTRPRGIVAPARPRMLETSIGDALMSRLVLSSIAAVLLAAPSARAQTIWHVDASAAPGGDGSSWANALDSLQPALDAAASTDQIWVAAGTYHPTL